MQKLLTSGDVCEILKPIGITPDVFRGWCERGGARRGETPDFPAIVPAEGGSGHGRHRQFTFMQVVGIAVAAKLYVGVTGCQTSYIRMVVDAFGGITESQLLKLFKHRTGVDMHYLRYVSDGVPHLGTAEHSGQVNVYETYREVLTAIGDMRDRLKGEGRTGRVRGSAV